MKFSILMLFTALCLSAVSAYYSIVGLTAIFAAAVIPITIMGVVLELSKIMVTLWCHTYWEVAPIKLKLYLVPSVIMLMVITSMGTYGYLAKAHLAQTVPSDDIQSQVALYDEKIKTERDNIEADRKALVQMDNAVDQTLSRTIDENGADKASKLRNAQRKERAKLQKNIELAQKQIAQIQEARAPIASKYRQIVADVGPIKYIAALIYGDKTNDDMLEAAVRWVIIIIVLVFDPLAIVMLLAATSSLDWARKKKESDEPAKADEPIVDSVAIPVTTCTEEEHQQLINDAVAKVKNEINTMHQDEINLLSAKEQERYTALLQSCSEKTAVEVELAEVTTMLKKVTEDFNTLVPTIITLEEDCAALMSQDKELKEQLSLLIENYDALLDEKLALEQAVTDSSAELHDDQTGELQREILNKATEIDTIKTSMIDLQNEIVEKNNEIENIKSIFAAQQVSLQQENTYKDNTIQSLQTALHQEITEKNVLIQAAGTRVAQPNILATADNLPSGGNAGFGISFPTNPSNGDLFLRVDYMPSILFKWLGTKWVEIDKTVTDAYAYNEEYIKLLISKLESGEYSVDDLSDQEREQVAQYLNQHPK